MKFPVEIEYGPEKLTPKNLRKLRDRVGYHVNITFEGTGETARYRVSSASPYGARLLLDQPDPKVEEP